MTKEYCYYCKEYKPTRISMCQKLGLPTFQRLVSVECEVCDRLIFCGRIQQIKEDKS